MGKQPPYQICLFLPYRQRRQTPRHAQVYDVSSYAEEPFCTLSPLWPHSGIPVPGWPGQTSDSVEGIWQGLKIIRGQTAPRYFQGTGKKRGGKPQGHWYGGKILKLVEARERVYRVAYEWMLTHCVAPELLHLFVQRAFARQVQYFHDISDNGTIANPDEGWAHAAVLVQFLNRSCQQFVRSGRMQPRNGLPTEPEVASTEVLESVETIGGCSALECQDS